MVDLIAHLEDSIDRASRNESGLCPDLSEQFPVYGMSGKKGRALINNICSMPGTRYLEIGLWQGSTFCSALHGNTIRAVGIDDWSEFHGPQEVFRIVLNAFLGDSRVSVVDMDCWKVFLNERFNVFFYDGGHSVIEQYRALAHFGRMMDEEFIMVIDDFNSPEVHEGTEMAVNDLGYEILYQRVLGADGGHQDADGWWNGMVAMVLRRPQR